jgi:hypothetical protein
MCPACTNMESTIATITPLTTTTHELINKNGALWLGLPTNGDVLGGKSAFKLFSTHGATIFGGQPNPNVPFSLTLKQKKVQNPLAVLAQVE